jgi:glyoxylase-like metal-dependent hydrolase (beta-lactamase superfamily II)
MSAMKVMHLDCCTMCPLGSRWVNEARHLVGHVLAVETDAGDVVLVDTGIGIAAMSAPKERLGRFFTTFFRPSRDSSRTAVRQLEVLGYGAGDVRHVILTHLDVDHAGGLSDFPDATIHVHAAEQAAAMAPRTINERSRYRAELWEHGPHWSPFLAEPGGDSWNGFEQVTGLPGVDERILIVPLAGHTRGHCAVAVHSGDRWLIHAGDGYFHGGVVHPDLGPPGRYLSTFERGVAVHRKLLAANHARLAEIARTRHDVDVFCAHDPAEFERLREPSGD